MRRSPLSRQRRPPMPNDIIPEAVGCAEKIAAEFCLLSQRAELTALISDAMRQREAKLRETLNGWLKENNHGGWIDTLRVENDRFRQREAKWEALRKAAIAFSGDVDNACSCSKCKALR